MNQNFILSGVSHIADENHGWNVLSHKLLRRNTMNRFRHRATSYLQYKLNTIIIYQGE